MDLLTVSLNLVDPGSDDHQLHIFRAPTNAHGGGVRLLEAFATNGAATAAGTTFTLCMHKYSNAGTPAVNGTISDVLGGTADYWADQVPKEFTLTAAYTFLDAGESLILDYQETAASAPTDCTVTCLFQVGN